MLRFVFKILSLSLFTLVLTACGGGGGDDGDDGGGNGGGSGSVDLTAPTGVTATGYEQTIGVTWNPVTGVEHYKVYYKTSAGVTTSDSMFDAQGTGYNHNDLSEGDTFYYAVVAVNNGEESDLSAEVSATAEGIPVPPQASGRVLIEGGDESITLSWADAEGATSYEVHYAEGNAQSSGDVIEVADATSPHVISGLTNGQEYVATVLSVNDDGNAESQSVSTIADVRMTVKHYAPRMASTATNGSVYVMVGQGGAIYTAQTDGSAKTAQESGTKYDLYSIAYGANTFVTTGARGIILTSTDGITWAQSYTENGGAMDKVMFSNDTFYAIGQTAVLTSSDGLTWSSSDQTATMCNEGPENDNYLEHMAYGDGKLVVTASTGCMKLSTNEGVTWVANSVNGGSDTKEVLGLVFDGTQFAAISRDNGPLIELHTSTDGISWTTTTITDLTSPTGLAFGEGVFVTTDSDNEGLKHYSSSDGLTWTEGAAATLSFSFVAHTGTDFVTVGSNLALVISADGISWTNTSADVVAPEFIKVLNDGGQYIAISSEGGVYTSPDLTSWTLQTSFALSNGRINDVEVVGSIITLAGQIGFSSNSTSGFVSSHSFTNGADYSANWGAADVSAGGGINALTHDGTRYLAATRATVSYSGNNPWDNILNQPAFLPYLDIEADGTSIVTLAGSTVYHELASNVADWTNVSTATTGVSQLSYYGSSFYGFSSSQIVSSSDGLTWSQINSDPLSGSVYTHDGSKFVSLTGSNNLVTTGDFITETLRGGRDSEYQGEIRIHDVFWDGSQLVMVGSDGFVATHPGYD